MSEDTETTTRRFVILRDAGMIPEKKGPFRTYEQTLTFVREAIACRPTDTLITVAALTWNQDLWVEDGRALVFEEDTMAKAEAELRAERTARRLRRALERTNLARAGR